MKRLLVIFFLAVVVNCAFGQTENPNYKSIADSFERFYNADNYEAIFSLFGTQMQTALPLDKTKEFFTGLKSQAGKITKREFIKYENGSYASYKTNFERALFAVNISV
ncbi:MAG: DUF3887 domain-containing protein, partial [Bacteroidales bacterium]